MTNQQQIKYSERAAWPGLILSPAEWHWFDSQDADTQRDYYRYMTHEPKVEA